MQKNYIYIKFYCFNLVCCNYFQYFHLNWHCLVSLVPVSSLHLMARLPTRLFIYWSKVAHKSWQYNIPKKFLYHRIFDRINFNSGLLKKYLCGNKISGLNVEGECGSIINEVSSSALTCKNEISNRLTTCWENSEHLSDFTQAEVDSRQFAGGKEVTRPQRNFR